jgi:hypothetical protein
MADGRWGLDAPDHLEPVTWEHAAARLREGVCPLCDALLVRVSDYGECPNGHDRFRLTYALVEDSAAAVILIDSGENYVNPQAWLDEADLIRTNRT